MLKMLWDEHKEKGRDVNGISQKLDPTTRSMLWGFKLAQDVANEEEQKQEWKLEYAERLIPMFSMEGKSRNGCGRMGRDSSRTAESFLRNRDHEDYVDKREH